MTIEEAINQLVESSDFKEAARVDAKLRVQIGRIKKDGIKHSAAIELLQKFGYLVDIKKPPKKK